MNTEQYSNNGNNGNNNNRNESSIANNTTGANDNTIINDKSSANNNTGANTIINDESTIDRSAQLMFSDNDIHTIAKKIMDHTICSFDELIEQSLIDRLYDYSLVITGTVGSGKSTICESLVYLFNLILKSFPVITYPEFLFVSDNRLSMSLLGGKFNGNISSNTFQSFILDEWITLLNRNKNKRGFKIFERCVDDTAICFCNMENKNNRLSDLQLLSLYERVKDINNKYHVPSYCDPLNDECKFTKVISGELNDTIVEILHIIHNDLKNNVKQRIIGLSVSFDISKFRIRQRSRTGESGYTDEQIRNYIHHYETLYDMLLDGKYISRFVDLGTLM